MSRTALPTIRASLSRALKNLDALKDGASEKDTNRAISALCEEIEYAEACARQLEYRNGKVRGVNPNNGEIT